MCCRLGTVRRIGPGHFRARSPRPENGTGARDPPLPAARGLDPPLDGLVKVLTERYRRVSSFILHGSVVLQDSGGFPECHELTVTAPTNHCVALLPELSITKGIVHNKASHLLHEILKQPNKPELLVYILANPTTS